jgi:hypothetical protein
VLAFSDNGKEVKVSHEDYILNALSTASSIAKRLTEPNITNYDRLAAQEEDKNVVFNFSDPSDVQSEKIYNFVCEHNAKYPNEKADYENRLCWRDQTGKINAMEYLLKSKKVGF